MSDILYLAWKYLLHHRGKTLILLVSITLILYLPVGMKVLVDQSAAQLTARAEATPLLVGSRGSPLELVLSSLYFESDPPRPSTYAQVERVRASGFAAAVPLHVRFRVQRQPIVGTSLDYFDYRGLRTAEGRRFAVLGECVLGAAAARALEVGVGDAVISSPETVFQLAGVYPLRMKVVGILEPAHNPDDVAVFVDLKTAWVIEGLGHGHQDLTTPDVAGGVLSRTDTSVVANASVVQYNEITPENADSFHFHGSLDDYPVQAVIVFPHDERSATILQGRYLGDDDAAQIVRPTDVMDELLATVLTVRSYVITAVLMVGISTLATTALVFLLSLRLRRGEIRTLLRIGASRARVVALVSTEIGWILLASVALATLLTVLTATYGSEAIRAVILD